MTLTFHKTWVSHGSDKLLIPPKSSLLGEIAENFDFGQTQNAIIFQILPQDLNLYEPPDFRRINIE